MDKAGVYTLIPTDQWTQLDANSIAITITDGGEFDLDGVVNGSVVGPIAIGTTKSAVVVPIPTLGQWGLILLSLMMAVFGLLGLHRQQTTLRA